MSQYSKYFRIRLMGVPSQDLDLLTDLCFDYQAQGVEEVLDFHQPDLIYDPIITKKDKHDVNVYFNVAPGMYFFEELRKRFPNVDAVTFEEENKDWLSEWKKGFEPFSLSGGYWIVPSWHQVPTQAEKPIILDPGMAFGTGTHATTQLAAELLLDLSSSVSQKGSVLDVGTGTGIIAMMAAMEGFQPVVGLDIDPEARRTARENSARNDITRVEISDLLIHQWQKSEDVVIANIIDGVLLQLKPDLMRALKPQGHLILSGILVERENLFMAGFMAQTQFSIVQRRQKDEWVAYWIKNQQ